MSFSPTDDRRRIVADSIHGDIELTPQEWRIADTASFQRLRYIKQLGMAHLVYPNATHTRFAHSIGALRIMQRILEAAKKSGVPLEADVCRKLRLAALLHDVGHYPYSHLMEGIDKVVLVEEFVDAAERRKRELPPGPPYPDHVQCGVLAVTHQPDLVKAIGGDSEAREIADLCSRSGAADPELSKFVSSSLDMDRLDYLLRDARAAGVPYGEIDLNYILNSFRVSAGRVIGVTDKALPAAEHYLFARYYMHRAVYHHKTVYGFEEAARHLIRRIRDRDPLKYGLPLDGRGGEQRVCSDDFRSFTDSFLDRLMQDAVGDSDTVVAMIARSLLERRPPKRLREVVSLEHAGKISRLAADCERNCRSRLPDLAQQCAVPLNRFIFSKTRPLSVEKRTSDEGEEQESELVRVFLDDDSEPSPIVNVDRSVINRFAPFDLSVFRLYIIDDGKTAEDKYQELRTAVRTWKTE